MEAEPKRPTATGLLLGLAALHAGADETAPVSPAVLVEEITGARATPDTLADSGALPHRVYLPAYLRQLGDGPVGGPEWPALDGMCGAVLKVFRELRRGALGLDWVRLRWERICRLMDHVARTWDPEGTGILHDVQPSTHEGGLNGANTYMGTY
ncbi:MAG: hypothetical protein GX596_14160 [Propionibacterium sp.]|nr:hypothetical protein [Propionibacterium sp.]